MAAAAMSAWDKRYTHDCPDCEWRFQSGAFDMYFCARADTDMGGSIIARYGNDGSEYASYPLAILFRPIASADQTAHCNDSFVAASRAALDLHMSGRIGLRFAVKPDEP